MSARSQLRVLGGFRLLDAAQNDIPIPSRKLCAMIAYVALAGTGREPRDRLTGLLWSEKEEKLAGQSLRQAVRKLRVILAKTPVPGLMVGDDFVSFDDRQIDVDLHQAYARIVETGSCGDAGPSCEPSGTLLDGFESVDSSFDTWLSVMRSTISERFVVALEDKLNTASAEVAARAAACLVRIDQTHEGAYRVLMEHKARSGNEAGALKDYERLWNLLDADHDMEPTLETQNLVAQIKLGKLAQASPKAKNRKSARAWRPPTIFVRGFVQGGPCSGDLFLVGGFRQELIGALVRFREWRIKDWAGEMRSLADDWPSDTSAYILEGSYYSLDNALRVVVTLKEFREQTYLWSEQVELTMDRWFEAQSEIIRKIAHALNVYISAERLNVIEGVITDDLYAEWLRGQDLLTQRWRSEAHAEAKKVFAEIIAQAPEFGRAYSSLVQIENAAPLVQPGVHRTPERQAESITLARKAVALDALDARAQLCLAWALAINGQFRSAELNFANACALNSNDSWTLISAALGWGFCGRHEEAAKLSAQALALDLSPSASHWGYRGTLKFLAGKDRDCVEAIDLAEDVLINLPAWRAAALAHLGDRDGARRSMRRFLDLVEDAWVLETKPDEEAVAAWLTQCFPIGDRVAAERFRNGLCMAGLPAP